MEDPDASVKGARVPGANGVPPRVWNVENRMKVTKDERYISAIERKQLLKETRVCDGNREFSHA